MTANKQVYLIGIGGIGMSALARYFKATGASVSGSDLEDSKILKELRLEGIKVKIGHNKRNIQKNSSLVIYNQAVQEDNREFKEAKKRGVKLLSYPEVIGELTTHYKTIAIAGSHGKSTTTALMSMILINAGLDPTVIVGTRMRELIEYNDKIKEKKIQETKGTNFKMGKSNWLVLEADEYGRAFHHYSPFAALVTNIDKEHLDTYVNLAGVKKSFLKFISNIQENGILVLNSADKNTKSIENEIIKICKSKKVSIHWYDTNEHLKGLSSLKLLPSLLGTHNISNASGSYVLAKALKINDQIIYSTLKNFKGTWRRLEYRGSCHMSHVTCSVYDDYAHHPTEIKASLAALKSLSKVDNLTFEQSNALALQHPPLICVFQPHQIFRLTSLFDDFVDSFKDADILILLPVYKVRGRENESRIKNQELRIDSKKLATAIQNKYPDKKIIYLKNPKQISRALISLLTINYKLSTTSTVVMMGAGDIIKYTDLLLQSTVK